MAQPLFEHLFTEFPPISTEKWEEKIREDLKGADYDKKLIWRTLEGFNVKPYYRSEHTENLETVDTLPSEFPFVRGNKPVDNNWLVRQDIDVQRLGVVEANRKALEVLNKGVTSLGFVFANDFQMSQADFSTLVKGIVLNAIELNFVARHGIPAIVDLLGTELKTQNIPAASVYGSISLDPIGYMSLRGNFNLEENEVFNVIKEKVENISAQLPNFKLLAINGHFFHNCGASIVQELGFSLSVANEYVAQLTSRGAKIEDLAPRMKFNFAVGGNYFLEIAKVRAARLLWAKIVEQYNPHNLDVSKIDIHSVTSSWNKSIYDPYVNVLRTTTEAMSAVISGTDSLTINPFDESYKNSDTISERIARNQQLILKEESFLDKIADPSAGSYYIENLTVSIVNEAWKLFLEIESKGGYLAAFKEGFVQTKLEETATTRDSNIATRREIFLGTNQFPNLNEKMNEAIETLENLNEKPVENQIGRPIRLYRGTMAFDEVRLKTEQSGKTPKVFLLTFGNLAMRKARAMFATNFFGCAGFQIVDNAGFATVDDAIKAATDSKAEVVVICSSDDEYAQIVTPIFEALNQKTKIVLAGYPANLVDEFKKMGLKHFIHVKSNALETLKQFQKELGIN